jgi:predicted lipoprotein with Yx(FWY)xxD motif
MERRRLSAAVAASALLVATCGSDTGVGISPTSVPAARSDTVSIRDADGTGSILVDSSGKALYTPDQEADGTVHCVDACVSYWVPLAPGAATPTAAPGAPSLGVIDRPDGTKQVTAGGRPLYTFSPDPAGKVTGDGVSDDFGDQHFTWRVVRADGTTPSTPAATTPGSPSGPGYGY